MPARSLRRVGFVALLVAVGSAAVAADPPVRQGPADAPEFPPEAGWAQGEPLKMADLKGRVVVVHFWTNGCVNCAHNYPLYRAWGERYKDKKLTIVGVHTPEFAAEAPAERVRDRLKRNRLTFPVVLDDDYAIWKAWGNRYWPSVYVVDAAGKVRLYWEGELHLKTDAERRFRAGIDELLKETK